MTVKFIVANDKGGVGKSTVAQFAAVEARRRHDAVHVIEYDGQHRLKRFFAADEVTSIPVTPDWQTRMADAAQQAEIWDPLIDWLDDTRPTVIDFGAQVWDAFSTWAGATMLSDIVDTSGITVLVPFTADLEAVAGAQRVAESLPRILPDARLVVLACDKDGDTAMLKKSPHFTALAQAVADAGGSLRSFPVMVREGYPMLAAQGFRFDRIVESQPRALAHASGLPLALAARTVSAIRTWIEAARETLDDAFIENPVAIAAAPPAPVRAAAPLSAPAPAASEVTAAPEVRPPVFDDEAYLALYPDVAGAVAAGVYTSGYQHYLERGMREGRTAPARRA